MARYTGPKARIARRHGVNIFGTEKYTKILTKKNYKPGMHGRTGFSKPSEYGKQLLEKQRCRAIYGVSETQLRNYFRKAVALKQKSTSTAFMEMLEGRMDNAVYRCGFAMTRPQARQFVSHGLFLLNGRRVTVPSIQLKHGDKFELRKNNKTSPIFIDILKQKPNIPKWLKADPSNILAEVIGRPAEEDFEKLFNPQLIVEYYSK